MKTITIITSLFLTLIGATAQVGINKATPSTGALLEFANNTNNNISILLPRVNGTAKITTPSAGMIIFDTSVGCAKLYTTAWSNCTANNGGAQTTISPTAAQEAAEIGTTGMVIADAANPTATASTILDLQSTSLALVLPRIDDPNYAIYNNLTSSLPGMIAYDGYYKQVKVYDGNGWKPLK